MTTVNKEYNEKLLRLIREAIQGDINLREKYKIGDKFRFIRDRLQALCSRIEESVNVQAAEEKKENELAEDEMLVYVYLYNAHGLVFQTWRKMLSPTVFYEYSVNRPIYKERSHVESVIRTKTTKVQHGFIAVAIKRAEIIEQPADKSKDALGNNIIKVKEGSLKINKVHFFMHNDQEYKLSIEGEITKKSD